MWGEGSSGSEDSYNRTGQVMAGAGGILCGPLFCVCLKMAIKKFIKELFQLQKKQNGKRRLETANRQNKTIAKCPLWLPCGRQMTCGRAAREEDTQCEDFCSSSSGRAPRGLALEEGRAVLELEPVGLVGGQDAGMKEREGSLQSHDLQVHLCH